MMRVATKKLSSLRSLPLTVESQPPLGTTSRNGWPWVGTVAPMRLRTAFVTILIVMSTRSGDKGLARTCRIRTMEVK